MSIPSVIFGADADAGTDNGSIRCAFKIGIAAAGDGNMVIAEAGAYVAAEGIVVVGRGFAADVVIDDGRKVVGEQKSRVVVSVAGNAKPDADRRADIYG